MALTGFEAGNRNLAKDGLAMQSFAVCVKTWPNHACLKIIAFHKLRHCLRSEESVPCLDRTGPIPTVNKDTHYQSCKVEQDFFGTGLPCILLPGTMVAVVMENSKRLIVSSVRVPSADATTGTVSS